MAKGFQSPTRTRFTITTTTTTFITTVLALVASLTLCSGARQGCHLHPQERLVSCRGVTSDILQEFLVHVNTSTSAATTMTTTTPTTTTTTTTTTTDDKNETLPLPPDTTDITTTAPPSPDNTTNINTTTTTTTTTAPDTTSTTTITTAGSTPQQQQHTTSTTITTTTTTESKSGDDAIKNSNTGSDRYDAAGATELSCVGCRLPRLTQRLLGTPVTLERLSIIDSGVEEVDSGALTSHAPTLVHLDLSYNLLRTLPEDVVSLTRLQVLDLKHNGILEVAEGTSLTLLHGLRHLYLDYNKLGQTISSSRGQRSHPSVFDLWASEGTTALPRLSHLGLSHNGITDVPDGAFANLPSLLVLDLSDNLLPFLRPSVLPSSVLELDLRGNPWNCTCQATWILERHARLPPTPSFLLSSTYPFSSTSVLSPSPATVAGTILSPTCSSPLHLQRRHLDSLTVSEVCPLEEDAAQDEVVYIGDDVEGALKEAFGAMRLLNATSLTKHALLISWRVDASFYSFSSPPREPLSWVVTVREARQGPRQAQVTGLSLDRYRQEQPHWAPGDGLFAEVLEGLRPATGYVICLTVEQRRRLYTRPGHCLHGTTLTSPPPRPTPSLSSADVTPEGRTPVALQSYSTRDYTIRTEDFTAWTDESRRATLSWNVTVLPPKGRSGKNLLLRPLGWRLTFRRFESEEEEKEEQLVLVSRGGEPLQNFTNHYSIEGLQPGTGYVFCLDTLTEEEVQESLAEDGAVEMPESASPPLPVGALSQEKGTHSQPSAARGRSVTDSRGGATLQQLDTLDDTLSSSPPPIFPPAAADPTLPPPEAPTPPPGPGGDSLFRSPTKGSTHAIVHNLPPQPSSSSNIPPPPPNLPSLPANRPPRPPRPDAGGGFVYTSTGLRIPLPSGSSGSFSVPPPLPISRPGPQRGFPPEPPSRSPTRQRYIYEFEEASASPPSTPQLPPPSSTRQTFTYPTRRRREVAGGRPPRVEAAPLCRQMMTPAELDVVLPAAIAGTVSCAATVVVVLVVCCCCWPRRCCRRKDAWRARSTADSRKVNTISAPTPVTVFSTHSSGAAATVAAGTAAAEGRGNGDGTASRRENPDGGKAGRTVSATSSSGYLTPLQSPDGRDPHIKNPDPKAAYLSLMQSRLMQRHKDLPEFHPGYDIPPMASAKSLVGYDYPHPTPVNPIGRPDAGTRKPAATTPPVLPSPGSSDSNYNVSVGNSPLPMRSPTEVNLNIPCQQPKSSALTKSVHVPPDASGTFDDNYINPNETPGTTATRTYLKHPPSRTRNRRFGQPQAGAAEHSEPISRSTPDLVTAISNDTEAAAVAGDSNLPVKNYPFPTAPSPGPASLPPAASSEELTAYVNLPQTRKDSEVSEAPMSNGGSDGKERGAYHTWSGHPARPRPSVGDVVLTGGTLIEVPEGYVQPQAPKPTPFIRLLVRGQDGPKDPSLDISTQPPSHTEGLGGGRRPSHGSSVTHLLASGADRNTLVINTAPAS